MEAEPTNHNTEQFIAQIRIEMKYRGFNQKALAKSIYVTEGRLKSLLLQKAKFNDDEIRELNKVLGL